MTDDKPNLELIREAAEAEKKATPGPWEAFKWGDGSQYDSLNANICAPDLEVTMATDLHEHDAQAIAALHNAFPEIVKAVEGLGHGEDCEWNPDYYGKQRCTCGLDALRAALRGDTP